MKAVMKTIHFVMRKDLESNRWIEPLNIDSRIVDAAKALADTHADGRAVSASTLIRTGGPRDIVVTMFGRRARGEAIIFKACNVDPDEIEKPLDVPPKLP